MIELFAFALTGYVAPQEDSIRTEDFRRHIEFLASPEMKGRNNGTPEGAKAAQYVADEMKRIGLKPAGSDGYFHRFKASKGRGGDVPEFDGVNVIGLLEGTELKNEYVVLNAHHDHLGVLKGSIRPGADDNASGVAMILELAEAFAKKPTRRNLLFISFDCEEDGLVGSREFVNSGLYDPKSIAADFCFDLIGGDFYPWESTAIYALGSETSPEIASVLAKHSLEGLAVRRCGVYLIEPMGFSRSDYGNFRTKKVPFLFFSTGTPWYYHTSHDTPDKINWTKITLAGRFCYRVIAEVADAKDRPTMGARPPPSLEDAEFLRAAVEKVLGSEEVHVTEEQRELGKNVLSKLDAILQVGKPTEGDRGELRQAMAWLFEVQKGQITHYGK